MMPEMRGRSLFMEDRCYPRFTLRACLASLGTRDSALKLKGESRLERILDRLSRQASLARRANA